LRTKNGVVIVPNDAVLGLDNKYVFVVENNKAVRKDVTIGMQNDNDLEILSGLKSSDTLIVSGQRVVEDGSGVTIVKE
ncbi:MAG: efflux RND transporter periplasmic adaptor subunit, partial [bacterium]